MQMKQNESSQPGRVVGAHVACSPSSLAPAESKAAAPHTAQPASLFHVEVARQREAIWVGWRGAGVMRLHAAAVSRWHASDMTFSSCMHCCLHLGPVHVVAAEQEARQVRLRLQRPDLRAGRRCLGDAGRCWLERGPGPSIPAGPTGLPALPHAAACQRRALCRRREAERQQAVVCTRLQTALALLVVHAGSGAGCVCGMSSLLLCGAAHASTRASSKPVSRPWLHSGTLLGAYQAEQVYALAVAGAWRKVQRVPAPLTSQDLLQRLAATNRDRGLRGLWTPAVARHLHGRRQVRAPAAQRCFP